jgi:hypothetical protein
MAVLFVAPKGFSMENLRRSFKIRNVLPLLALPFALTAFAPAPSAHAAKRPALLEAWPGQRVLFLLPIQLGEGFNVDRAFGQALLPRASESLQHILQNTGKFSVVEAHRFNPILQRALTERRITNDELTNLINEPTKENVRLVFSKIDFDQPPMFAEFTLEEVRLSGTQKDTQVQTQISGRLYELANPVALKSTVITSNSFKAPRVSQATLLAANDVFAQTAAEFTRPIDEIQIELPEAPAPVEPEPVAAATPAPPAPVVVNGITLPGDVPIQGSSTRGQ